MRLWKKKKILEDNQEEKLNKIIKEAKDDFQKELSAMQRDLEFWHKTFRAFSVVPCAYCSKQMRIYPYGGAYYHIKDNQKVHTHCYDEYLQSIKRA